MENFFVLCRPGVLNDSRETYQTIEYKILTVSLLRPRSTFLFPVKSMKP